ncbi:MAG: PSD1 and planctomycete cytochrome C domain-containing protein [Aureliella sp.]
MHDHQIVYARRLTTFVVLTLASFAPVGIDSALAQQVDFQTEIRPLLNEHCVACHGGVKQAADLSFVYQDQLATVVEPGSPDDSYLLERIVSDDAEERMPPPDHGRALNADEIALLSRWIRQGADWGAHWAFQPPTRQEPPELSESDNQWCRKPIDPFILAKMKSAGLEPSPDASPLRWLRRASLDITGLPPTAIQREEFLAALKTNRKTAYADAVDRFLQSPAYGERWASPWLDAVRYADSRGLGLDGKRNIWKYRDWVIDALNADMPYDQFTTLQLAGDLLPDPSLEDLVATACNRLTQTNEEGGTDDEQFRVEAVVDRTNTTWQVWQGLSFGCVQCHSHPYDPIRHEEYYQFLAFFNNTADCDLEDDRPNLAVPVDKSQYGHARELDRNIENEQRDIWAAANEIATAPGVWTPIVDMEASTNNKTKVVVESVDERAEYQTRGNVAKSTTVVMTAVPPSQLETLTAVRFTGLPVDLDAAKLDSEWGFVISNFKIEVLSPKPNSDDSGTSDGGRNHWESIELKVARVVADEPEPLLDPMDSLNPKSSRGVGAYSRMNYPRSGVFVLDEATDVPPGCRLRISVAQNVFALGAFPLVAHRGRVDLSSDSRWTQWVNDKTRWTKLSELTAQRKKIRSVNTPILVERPSEFARPTAVFDRGNYLTKADAVDPSIPDFVDAGFSPSSPRPTRLDMARWLVHESNPLTSRVMVNRIWGQLFGIGLVETQEDFGSAGTPPSHPELLDDLAVRFRADMGWSIKSLIREIVLSSAYRQASAVSKDKLAADPRNRLLSRGPRNRLSAEIVRDQALAISGLLSKQMHGEPVHPPIPDGVWRPFASGDKWRTPPEGDPNRYRRTIYTYTKRSIQFPIMASFDAPTREACTVRRLPSNTPLQALMTLNDSVFLEASRALAKKMLASSEDLERQIAHGFVSATCRPPKSRELNALQQLYHDSLSQSRESSADASTTDSARTFAMQQVATVLLNLDEVLNQ